MELKKQLKSLITDDEVKTASNDFIETVFSSVLGDPIAVVRLCKMIISSPFFLRERLFYNKLMQFYDGVYLNDDDRRKLNEQLMRRTTDSGEPVHIKDGSTDDNALRLVECIDHAESTQKVQYLINATRSLLAEFIDRDTFFRICNLISHTVDEDLQFLRDNIEREKLSYSFPIQGLLASGLMYQSIISDNGDQAYSFTPIAEIVDKFAISANDETRYPNPCSKGKTIPSPNPTVKAPTYWNE